VAPQRRKDNDVVATGNKIAQPAIGCWVAALMLLFGGCSAKPEPAGLKRLAAGAQTAGFLTSYDSLKPNPNFENTLTSVKQDDAKNIHRYFAVIIDPVDLYVATNADVSKLPDRGRTALAAYFQNAITRAVSDAFPVVQEPGPLVLRLRTALIGVDVASGGEGGSGADALPNAIDIGKVAVEMEMVDSVTGEQIAAVIDRQSLGAGATVGSVSFSHDEQFAAAKDAFDGWAARLRQFLDSAHELSPEQMQRAEESYRPYGDRPKKK
jgi:hypothetical protein